MSDAETKPDIEEVDMGETGMIAQTDTETMVRQDIEGFIDAVYNTDYTSAEKQFSQMVGDRLQQQLDQAKVAMAGQMFNNDAPEESEEEVEFEVEEEEDTAEMEGKYIYSGSSLEDQICINNLMKSFKNIREKKMPAGDHVFQKKVNRHTVMVHKDSKGFSVYIDGDKLDTYRTQKEAEKMGVTFAKEM